MVQEYYDPTEQCSMVCIAGSDWVLGGGTIILKTQDMSAGDASGSGVIFETYDSDRTNSLAHITFYGIQDYLTQDLYSSSVRAENVAKKHFNVTDTIPSSWSLANASNCALSSVVGQINEMGLCRFGLTNNFKNDTRKTKLSHTVQYPATGSLFVTNCKTLNGVVGQIIGAQTRATTSYPTGCKDTVKSYQGSTYEDTFMAIADSVRGGFYEMNGYDTRLVLARNGIVCHTNRTLYSKNNSYDNIYYAYQDPTNYDIYETHWKGCDSDGMPQATITGGGTTSDPYHLSFANSNYSNEYHYYVQEKGTKLGYRKFVEDSSNYDRSYYYSNKVGGATHTYKGRFETVPAFTVNWEKYNTGTEGVAYQTSGSFDDDYVEGAVADLFAKTNGLWNLPTGPAVRYVSIKKTIEDLHTLKGPLTLHDVITAVSVWHHDATVSNPGSTKVDRYRFPLNFYYPRTACILISYNNGVDPPVIWYERKASSTQQGVRQVFTGELGDFLIQRRTNLSGTTLKVRTSTGDTNPVLGIASFPQTEFSSFADGPQIDTSTYKLLNKYQKIQLINSAGNTVTIANCVVLDDAVKNNPGWEQSDDTHVSPGWFPYQVEELDARNTTIPLVIHGGHRNITIHVGAGTGQVWSGRGGITKVYNQNRALPVSYYHEAGTMHIYNPSMFDTVYYVNTKLRGQYYIGSDYYIYTDTGFIVIHDPKNQMPGINSVSHTYINDNR